MEHNYGTQDVILAGSGNHIPRKRHYVYYGDNIKDLIKSANSQERNMGYFGILLDNMGGYVFNPSKRYRWFRMDCGSPCHYICKGRCY